MKLTQRSLLLVAMVLAGVALAALIGEYAENDLVGYKWYRFETKFGCRLTGGGSEEIRLEVGGSATSVSCGTVAHLADHDVLILSYNTRGEYARYKTVN